MTKHICCQGSFEVEGHLAAETACSCHAGSGCNHATRSCRPWLCDSNSSKFAELLPPKNSAVMSYSGDAEASLLGGPSGLPGLEVEVHGADKARAS